MARPGIMTSRPRRLPEYELYARLFRALGEPTRLHLLEQLIAVGPAKQRELVDLVGVTQSSVSGHLRILTWSGFIEARRAGGATQYKIYGDYPDRLLRVMREFFTANPQAAGGCVIAHRDYPALDGR